MKTDYSINQGMLTIRVLLDDMGTLRLVWSGTSVDRNPGQFLQPFFAQWSAEAEKGGYRFSMDFSRLRYMNSSTITPVIFLIQELKRTLTPVVLRYDQTVKWQQLAFSALRVFTSGAGPMELIGQGEFLD
jgi:hypothetical protein